MAIRSISRWEFDGLLRWRRILESFTGWHVEWFANDAGTLIGVVYEGRGEAAQQKWGNARRVTPASSAQEIATPTTYTPAVGTQKKTASAGTPS